MKNVFIFLLAIMSTITLCAQSDGNDVNDIETFIIEPVEICNTAVWVIADKMVPKINRACRAKVGCEYSLSLPTVVEHSKSQNCLDGIARILAEQTCRYYAENIPLTIFNGWQWEYTYSLAQFDRVSYDLPARGGCLENCWQAVMMKTTGSINGKWLKKNSPLQSRHTSTINIETFKYMRIRNGYPKNHKF